MIDIKPNVIDLYHGDKVTDFQAAAASGIQGVIHKATTGAHGRDDQLHSRRQAALNAGLLWGIYHWGTGADVADQVENFLSWGQPDAQTLVALDLENDANQMSLAQAIEFLQLIEQKLQRKAVLYSGNLIKEYLGGKSHPYLGSHRLWLASYNAHPTLPSAWSGYWLWQFTGSGHHIPGIPGDSSGDVDCNFYPGQPAQLKAEWAS